MSVWPAVLWIEMCEQFERSELNERAIICVSGLITCCEIKERARKVCEERGKQCSILDRISSCLNICAKP